MEQEMGRLRLGLTMLLCVMLMGVFSSEAGALLGQTISQPYISNFLLYMETGRDVRFSPSDGGFSPHFVESPPAVAPKPALPTFLDTPLPDIYYGCQVNPALEPLLESPLRWNLLKDKPTVLILHTHTTESYTKNGESYRETTRWRTLEEDHNMLSVGARVAQLLEAGGVTVVQDRTLHDYPSYNGAYVHAREAIREYLKKYPTIRLVLDLHRDALEDGNGQVRTKALVHGEDSAQLMLVVGTNHENYARNLSLALKLHAQLEESNPGLMRPLQLRGQRFNQDLSGGALLVEVGAAGNTHEEAMRAAEALAEGILALAKGTERS